MKKLILSVFILCISINAMALPVLNANTPGAEAVTIFPDHADKNLYYLAPTVFVVSKNETGVPNFSYLEFHPHIFTTHAIIQATLRPDFTYEGIEQAKRGILAKNPAARFAALPFDDSSVEFADSLKPLIESSDCKHPAGTVADEQTCAFELNSKGISVLRPMLKQGLAITTQFLYRIQGVRQNADGSYTGSVNTYQVAGRIGGQDLAKHPELFRDSGGDVIDSLYPASEELGYSELR